MKTKDRIIQASLELFNKHGERAMTTNHIAAHLGISPGNLYYHFRNKEDIIRRIFKEYVAHIGRSFQPRDDGNVSLEVMMTYLDEIFESMWRFRFFYSNLPELLSRDPELQIQYLPLQEKLAQRVIAILSMLKQAGALNVEEQDLEDLAHTVKIVVTFWISYQTTQAPEEQITKATIYHGVLKVLFILKPYFAEEYLPSLERLQKHYRKLADIRQEAEKVVFP
ncbi:MULTISPECIES: TetR/AcrR family transcriptional regulator [Corallincola]|uniref:TetR/AcrR family transcriptional regulator n=3 Tax=Corallincola TaxID=1775176 RepID=A0A368NMK8_9GAMM|nr:MULTISPECIES: TetR/AcrR family transcriptional regulator [Corallincola]RCU51085.1 TetR/AcrR family transcriptional regulator [Corallincola holothuriorum]TAA46016.1 TetR/AcrR family transcriptional regulator [Corallincola spongiicola]TCI04126.1 TetR/AcrR family transcriptional regulator [Corallincola luteus]